MDDDYSIIDKIYLYVKGPYEAKKVQKKWS